MESMESIFFIFLLSFRIMAGLVICTLIFVIILSTKKKNNNDKSMMEKSMNKENRPTNNVLVPDNVKKESQDKSTQKEDAKRYNVQYEKKMLETNGYVKENDSYKKADNIQNTIQDESEINPIDNKNDIKYSLNDDENDDDPIKNL